MIQIQEFYNSDDYIHTKPEVNEFIGSHKIIDIKYHFVDREGSIATGILVIYETDVTEGSLS